MSVCCRLYELIFHIGIAKKVKPFVDKAKKAIAEMEAKTKSEKTARAKATKEMNTKKAEMEKQASRDFQEAKKAIAEMEAKNKSEKAARAKATKEMNTKKAEMEKQASRDFQEKFEGPQGGGLRCFHPEPRKGGNSVTSICWL